MLTTLIILYVLIGNGMHVPIGCWIAAWAALGFRMLAGILKAILKFLE